MKKRTPLRRITPLKRGNGFKPKRNKIKPMSQKKAKFNALYALSKKMNPPEFEGMEAHHPMGRIGDRILCWVWVAPSLHQWIHDHATDARAKNWLLPEFDGNQSTGFEVRPWEDIFESHWPEKYKRENISKLYNQHG